MKVTVIDHVKVSAEVMPEQALAYVRRVLPDWEYRLSRFADRTPRMHMFASEAHQKCVSVPASATFGDYARRMAELCDDLVSLGVALQPGDVLLEMSKEPV